MTVELDIEQQLLNHFKEAFDKEIKVEAYDADYLLHVERAKGHPIGTIVLSHSAAPSKYDTSSENVGLYSVSNRFIVNILLNTSKTREELLNWLGRVRKCLYEFRYRGKRPKYISHAVSPQRFPDNTAGVYLAEIEIEITTRYPLGDMD